MTDMAKPTKRAWKLQEFVAHGSTVKCLAIGRKSGRVMVTGGEDNKVNLWAIGKTNCIMSLTGHTTAVECVKFCPAEEMVCAGSMSGAVKIWNLEAAKMVRTLVGHKGNVRCMDFHPHAEFVASGSMDSSIKLWDTRKKGCIFTYQGHTKCVNSLKFSPDGRWIASGSDDGSVKLWDLSVGKVLFEFQDHCGPVNDVDFHPNEFLLASGSSDCTVKFWDLESFQLVSSTGAGSGTVRYGRFGGTLASRVQERVIMLSLRAAFRCVFFNPDGACLFSGAEDLLEVYDWEPIKTCDTLVMGWNGVADISVSHNQLIAGAFSLTNVAVYVIDLKRVQPMGKFPSNSSEPQYISKSPFKTGSHARRSFSKDKRVSEEFQVMHTKPVDDADPFLLEAEPGDADIKDLGDYNKIFHPSQELLESVDKNKNMMKTLATEPQSSKVVRLSGASNPGVLTERPRGNVKEVRQLSVTTRVTTVDTSFTARARGSLVGSGALLPPEPAQSIMAAVPGYSTVGVLPSNLPVPVNRNSLPSKSSSRAMPTGPISAVSTSLVKPMEKATAMVRTSQHFSCTRQVESSTVSVVRPVMSVLPDSKEALTPQKAVVHPEQKLVPSQRDVPAGLDLDEFLPRHLQASHHGGGLGVPEMSEAEAVGSIMEQHKTILAVLHHRLRNIKIVLAQWSTKDLKMALETALNIRDQSTLVDILNVIAMRPQIWTLDMCQIVLPAIYDLLQSKYESHMSTGCSCLRIILKNFGSVIKTNITAPPGVGVDIPREERYHKCMSCYNQLFSIRSFLLKRQTMQGKLGHLFREMHILMQGLE
ncbi:katanin p80 WD40 repeat-containing subunit B1 isoform X5 [Ixodes scapularis]|uniref:katanin p80 WD40 repeat-containing subunit B1 isoform X5 n=1 Tax=Ixodes scapularis TaxID=6945 RepID=UPI001A9D07F5|nr:katanin p80 WD40 repeat-containing subunit B1 isoform X5 [Ixodes scapularis]